MVSDYAIEDLSALAAAGINLPPREIIRLNALGLKACKGKRDDALFALPRVAYLGDIVLREPTIAHEIFLADVERMCAFDSPRAHSLFCAWVYSSAAEDLPKLEAGLVTKITLSRIARHAIKRFKNFTLRQIDAACNYVKFGADCSACEFLLLDRPKKDECDFADTDYSVALGVVYNGVAIAANISIGEAKRMTRSALNALINRAIILNGGEISNRQAEDDYQTTLAALREKYAPKKVD